MDTSTTTAMEVFKGIRNHITAWYRGLRSTQRSYLNGAVCFLFSFAIKPFFAEPSKAALFCAALFWGAAMIADLARMYRKVVETLIGKILLLAVLGVMTNVSFAIAAQVVNELVGVDPSLFPRTITLTAALVAVPLSAIGLYITLIFSSGFLALYVMFHLLPNDNVRLVVFPWYKSEGATRYEALSALVQVVSFVAVSIVAYQWSQDGQKAYESFVQDKARAFLYQFEMFDKAPCPLQQGQKVAFIDGDRVLIASKVGEGISFAVQACAAGVGKL